MSELEDELQDLLDRFEERAEENRRKSEKFKGESLEHMYGGISIGRERCIQELCELLEERIDE